MKRYDSYKDSGVEWIGEIPNHWNRLPLKHFGQVTLGKMLTSKDKGGYHLKPYLRSKNIQVEKVDVSDVKEMWFSEIELEKLRVRKGDLLFNEGGDVGRTCLWLNELEECYIQNSVNRVRLENDNERYFLHLSVLYHSVGYYDSLVNRVSIPHLTKEKLESVLFLRPPVHEQQQIVSFLDTKTSLIDSLIEKTQRKIELLKEKRTSLINEVVTKGLNPNVEMKDSGVEWIGEIPNHWEITKMKYVVGHLSEKGKPEKMDIKISPENVESDTGVCFNLYSEHESEGMRFQKGDVLLNKLRLYLKKILFTEYDGYSLGEMIVLRTNHKLNNKYFYLLLFSQGLIDLLDSQSTGIKLPRVSPDVILNTEIVYPPISEQQQIVEYLDEQTQLIDKTISIEGKRTELLKEYRQSLISEVVTGKRKVV